MARIVMEFDSRVACKRAACVWRGCGVRVACMACGCACGVCGGCSTCVACDVTNATPIRLLAPSSGFHGGDDDDDIDGDGVGGGGGNSHGVSGSV